jgi:hypothetical protein
MKRLILVLLLSCALLCARAYAFSKAVLVIEENTAFTSVFPQYCRPGFCSSRTMPNLAHLINSPPSGSGGAIADNYDAIGHHSLPNYLSMGGGRYDGAIGQGCSKTATCPTAKDSCASGLPAGPWNGGSTGKPITEDDVTHELTAHGKSWHLYAENYPGPTSCSSGLYDQVHVWPLYFADVVNSSTQKAQLVDFTHFAVDARANALKQINIVVPNTCDDAHDGGSSCGLNHADSWLQTNVIDVLFSSTGPTAFKAGGGGVLMVTFDEGGGCAPSSVCPTPPEIAGGGTVVFALAGPGVKPAASFLTLFQHPSLTRLLLEGLGITTFPGNAGSAPSMSGLL